MALYTSIHDDNSDIWLLNYYFSGASSHSWMIVSDEDIDQIEKQSDS
jgi:hypothetical protein